VLPDAPQGFEHHGAGERQYREGKPNPQEALYLPVMRALSMFPCGTQVIDNLLPHPIMFFAAYPPEAEQVCGMVSC
jgi:hypothetical protein